MGIEWRDLLIASTLPPEINAQRRRAASLLWQGARGAIEAWRPAADPDALLLYAEVLEILGKTRKGTASKVKTIALGTFAYSLDLSDFGSLHAAYTYIKARNNPTCACAMCAYHHPTG